MPDRPRLLVMGTTGFAVPALERLLAEGFPVLAVYTQPPRPAGRGHKVQRTPMHEAAERLGLGVRTPATLKDPGVQAELAAFAADIALVGAYGLILPRPVLAAPRLGCINLHASLLPRWRGAAPIQRAIMAGDSETGLSLFQMEPGLDTGPVHAMRAVPILPTDTTPVLHDRLAALAAEMAPAVLQDVMDGRAVATPQPADGVSYAHKVTREEGSLDFGLPAALIERRLRALTPWPGCWCRLGAERLMLVEADVVPGHGQPGEVIGLPLTIACGEGALAVRQVQRQGRRAMAPAELQRGFAIPLHAVLAADR